MIKRYATFCALFTVFLFAFSTLYANNGGKIGSTSSGCTCHGSSNSATTVSIQGVSGSVTMAPGEQRSFTVVVAHSSLPHAGFNLAVTNSGGSNAGTLTAGSGTQVSSGELTHTTSKAKSGSETTWTFDWTAPSTTGTYTMKAAGNAVDKTGGTGGDAWNFMNNITITVANPMTVTSPNGGETWCRGEAKTISWNPVGLTGNVKIEISSNNGSSWSEIATVAVTPSTYNWTIPNNQPTGTQYLVKVTSVGTPTANDVSDAAFSIKANPTITTQPASVAVCVGQAITLNVATDNNSAYTFRWRKAGTPINGATNSTYTIPAATVNDAGNYDVVITGCSEVTSQQANVVIKTAPQLLSQSDDTSACLGKEVRLRVNANGTGLTYQWRKQGTNITGATTNELVLPALTNSDLQTYDCVISGECTPAVTTAPMKVSLTPASSITKQPRDTSICEGKELQFAVEATGSGLQYEWKRNGSTINGVQGPTYVIASPSDVDAATYEVTITNECGTAITTQPFKLTVRKGVALIAQTNDTVVKANTVTRLRAVGGGPNVRYKWSKGGQTRAGDTLSTLVITSTKTTDAGNYQCLVFNSCGNVETKVIKLTVTEPTAGPSLIASDATVDYGCQLPGLLHKRTTKIINGGGSDLTVTKVTIAGNGFALTPVTTPFTLKANEEKSLEVVFSTQELQEYTGSLTFESNSSTANPTIALKAKGCKYSINITDITAPNLGKTEIGQTKDTVIKVVNTGNVEVSITKVILTGDKEFFDVTYPALPLTLAIGASVDFSVKFTPKDTIERQLTFEIVSNYGPAAFKIKAQGKEKATSVQEELMNTVLIAPNPASSIMTMTVGDTPADIRIIDAMGMTIFTAQNQTRFVWNTEHVAAGRYTALVTIGNTTITLPLTVIR